VGTQHPSARRSRARLASKIQDAVLRLRLYSDELETLKERARTENKSLSSFVRDVLFSPDACQSNDNAAPIENQSESLSERTDQEEGGKFSARHLAKTPAGERRASGADSAPRDAVAGRTGHKNGCACFACVRLRGLLAEAPTTTACGSRKR